jgi:hypothetical protein
MTADKIHAGIKLALADMAGRGWLAENCLINPNETAVPTVERCLAGGRYDCVVVGAGVRLPPSRLALFEAVVKAIHGAAPQTAIAFNSRPEDTGAAAARWVCDSAAWRRKKKGLVGSNQNATTLHQPRATEGKRATSTSMRIQPLKSFWVGPGWVPGRLKIRVSVVQFHPWPPFRSV